jgi:alpha-1,2-mannosyltransferase
MTLLIKFALYMRFTVSSDMMKRVESRNTQGTYNNSSTVAKSGLLTRAKILYYRGFAVVYRWMGTRADVVMTNSSWTNNHIQNIWGGKPHASGGADKTQQQKVQQSGSSGGGGFKSTIVYPPVNVATFTKFPLEPRSNNIISIGQFRPEKNHMLQIESFALAIKKGGIDPVKDDCTLYLVGGARNLEDLERVAQLRTEIQRLNLSKHIILEVSVSFDRIKARLTFHAG